MPEVTDLMRVAQYAKSSGGAPADVYNAACRLLDNRPGFTLIDQALDAQATEVHVQFEDEGDA